MVAMMLCFTVGTTLLTGDWSSARAEVKLKTAYMLNYDDGEQKPIVMADMVEWKGINAGIWAGDFDDMIDGISNDWEAGIEANYKLITLKGIDLGVGYAIGARSPVAKEHELIHGVTLVVGTLSF